MRKLIWVTALTLGLALASSAHAQSSSSSSSSNPITSILKFPKNVNINVQPNFTNNSPMDYRNTSSSIGTSIINPPNNGSAFPLRMTQYFAQPARTNFISNTTPFASSTFPTPTQMQAAAPSYFKAFQMYRGSCIQP